jgi:hypothetical protein
MPTPINAPAKRDYKAVHSSGERYAAQIAYGVLHAGESPSAAAMGRWFEDPDSGGSTQCGFDCDETQRYLPDLVIPQGAPPLNTSGLHGELSGYSAWTPAGWLRRKRMLQRAAWKYAEWSIKYDIPARWLKAKQLKAIPNAENPGRGKGGITSHWEATKAFGKSTHTDPGPGFEKPATEVKKGKKVRTVPRRLFMGYVKKYRKQMLTPPKPKPKKKAKPPLSIEQSTHPPNQDRKK